MGSPLVPLALAGAAVYLLSSGKKRSKTAASSKFSYTPIDPSAIPPGFRDGAPKGDSPEAWVERQQALKKISEIEFIVSKDRRVPLCAKCDPKVIDGNPGPDTRNAIKAFQAIAGLDVHGEWGSDEDRAMHRILTAVSKGLPISCDPLLPYPTPFACFVHGEGFALMLTQDATPEPEPQPAPEPAPQPSDEGEDYGFDLLKTDPECNYIVHQDDGWFHEQKLRIVEFALNGRMDETAAQEIHESMLADYIPLCLSLGRNGVGPGVKQFWDANLAHVASELKGYELLPETLEEDANELGLQ